MSTDLTPSTADAKRDELRQKIEASERRIAERTLGDQAREAAEAALDYTKANPLKVVGGAIAVGLVIGLMTQPGRRAATRAATTATGAASSAASAVGGAVGSAASGAVRTVSNAAKGRSSKFGALVADSLVAYAIRMIDEVMDGARTGQDKLEDIGDSASAKARELRREASYIAGSAADKGRDVTRRTRRRAERAVRDLTDRARK